MGPINVFNGIYGMVTNTFGICNTIFGTDIGNSDLVLDAVLKNQKMLEDFSSDMDQVLDDLNTIMVEERLDEALLGQLVKINQDQTEMLQEIQDQLDAMTIYFQVYMGAIMGMLEQIEEMLEIVIKQLNLIIEMLSEMFAAIMTS